MKHSNVKSCAFCGKASPPYVQAWPDMRPECIPCAEKRIRAAEGSFQGMCESYLAERQRVTEHLGEISSLKAELEVLAARLAETSKAVPWRYRDY